MKYMGAEAGSNDLIKTLAFLIIAVIGLVLLLPYILKKVVSSTISEGSNLVSETIGGAGKAVSEGVAATGKAVSEISINTLNEINPDYNPTGSYSPSPIWSMEKWIPPVGMALNWQVSANLAKQGLELSNPKDFLPAEGEKPTGYMTKNGVKYYLYGADAQGYNATSFQEIPLWDLGWVGMRDFT